MTYDLWSRGLKALEELVKQYKNGSHRQSYPNCPLCNLSTYGQARCDACPYTILVNLGLLEEACIPAEFLLCARIKWNNPVGSDHDRPRGDASEAARAEWLEKIVIPEWKKLEPVVACAAAEHNKG